MAILYLIHVYGTIHVQYVAYAYSSMYHTCTIHTIPIYGMYNAQSYTENLNCLEVSLETCMHK